MGGPVFFGDTIYLRFFVHSAAGALVNADSTPTVDWTEDGAAAATTGVTISNVTTGEYKAAVDLSNAAFEVGKWYEFSAKATVGGVTSQQSLTRFYLLAAPSSDGVPDVNVIKWRNVQPAGLTANGYVQTALLRWLTDDSAGTPEALAGGRVASFDALELRRKTAQSGTATTLRLDASASAVDDFYNNTLVVIVSGTGAGQFRMITDYVGATKDATVVTWATTPDNTSVFAIFAVPATTATLGAGAITSTTFAANSITAAALAADAASEIATAVGAASVEGSATLFDLVRLLVGVICGTVADFESDTQAYRSLNGTKTRLTVTTDASGRIAIATGDLT